MIIERSLGHNMSQQLPEPHPQLPDAVPSGSRPHLQNPISDSMFHLTPFLILDQHIVLPPALQAFNPAEHVCPYACPLLGNMSLAMPTLKITLPACLIKAWIHDSLLTWRETNHNRRYVSVVQLTLELSWILIAV